MKADNVILQIYVDFVDKSMKDFYHFCIRSSELVRRSNLFNRKKNMQIIYGELQHYLDMMVEAWKGIYAKPSHFSDSTDDFATLGGRKSIYAVTAAQKYVEQFFYGLHTAIKMSEISVVDEKKFKEFDLSGSLSWCSVDTNMKELFKITLEALINHSISVDEYKKRDFIEINQKFIHDGSIKYRHGDILTDACMAQVLKDFTAHEKREREELEESLRNGNWRVDPVMYEIPEIELEEGLQKDSWDFLAEYITGSVSDCFAFDFTLPELTVINSDSLSRIVAEIEIHTRNATLDKKELTGRKVVNALYLGFVTGFSFLRSLFLNMSLIKEKFLSTNVLPADVPVRVLDYMGLDSNSLYAKTIQALSDKIQDYFPAMVNCTRYTSSKSMEERIDAVIKIAYKIGYNAYFRIRGVLPGKDRYEDQSILNKQFSTNYIQLDQPMANNISSATTIKAASSNTVQNAEKIVSLKRHEEQKKKYWLDENGIVKCPGNNCPVNCNTDCPIYAQTIALQKLTKNDFEGAAQLLRSATITEPSFADAWNNLAACYGQMGDHKNAFAAYQRSYELNPKPNPLYGMVVATKNMKDYELAKMFSKTYVNKFGSDDRISALIAEMSENELSKKISDESPKKTPVAEQVSPKPVADPSIKTEKPNQTDRIEVTESVSGKPVVSIEDMRRYGKYYLLLLDPDTRETGYAAMEKMENDFPEAAICLGQYYNGTDQAKAKKHIRVAADAGIAEGQWSYSQLLPHSHILDLSEASDKEYLKYCLAAAEGGCPDAANEMGNICHRKGFYAESTYWYGMAYVLEHPSGIVSLKGITKKWQQNGFSKEYVAHIDGFTENRQKTSLILYKMFTDTIDVQDLHNLMLLALDGEDLAGLIQAKLMEQHQKDETACKAYSIVATNQNAYALRCYADMLLAGKGTDKDMDAAFRMYEQAANAGNATAMFAMGQKAVKAGDRNLAACWFGQAYSRGFEMAGEWLSKLAE